MLQISDHARRMKRRKRDRPDRGRLHSTDRFRRVPRQPAGADRQDQPPVEDVGPRAGVPVIALSQLNRAVENREDKRLGWPTCANRPRSSRMPTSCCFLHRPEYYDANDQPGIAELIVAKNRNGATNTIKLTFLNNLTRFENFAAVVEPFDEGTAF